MKSRRLSAVGRLLAGLSVSLALLVLAGCARITNKLNNPEPPPPSPFGATGIPPQLRARASGGSAPTVGGGDSPATLVELTPEDEIIFTDPDNPDAVIPELAEVLAAAPKRRGPWEDSETIARRRASREGKPILIWFTNSEGGKSPLCQALSRELFAAPAFNEWAEDHLVRLRVDTNVRVTDRDLTMDEAMSRGVDMRRYVQRLRKQYKIHGNPTLVIVHPDGSVIARHRGYNRGNPDYTWGLIKQGEAAFQISYRKWREGLERRGYREWSDRNSRTVFARLARYSEGTLILIEPDGTRSKTHENKLSNSDRDWIAEQKKIRGL